MFEANHRYTNYFNSNDRLAKLNTTGTPSC